MDYYDKYPFLKGATGYIQAKGYSVDSLLSPGFEKFRDNACRRVMSAVGDTQFDEVFLLSYPIARMLVSIVGDPYLERRFAMREAKRAYEFLLAENFKTLRDIAADFDIQSAVEDNEFVLPFTDYLKYSAGVRDSHWKLINRTLVAGRIHLNQKDFCRLIEEAVRERISKFPPVPPSIAESLAPYTEVIAPAVAALKGDTYNGEVLQDAFPPCMRFLLAELQKGVNLPHTARFALTSFLADIGMDADEIMNLYRAAPDFREDLTRYQVEHIVHGKYTAPQCKTMQTFGNCHDKNNTCERVSHPLTYYRRAAFSAQR